MTKDSGNSSGKTSVATSSSSSRIDAAAAAMSADLPVDDLQAVQAG